MFRSGRALRRVVPGLAAAALVFSVAASGAAAASRTAGASTNRVRASGTSTPQLTAARPAISDACSTLGLIKTWSTMRLVDQLIVVPTQESSVSALAPSGSHFWYGGIILFGATAPSNLGSQIATVRSRVPGNLGLLAMTDEEGGGIQRMANLVGSMPWAYQMGEDMTPAQIEALATSVAKKMAANGVNVDLAPVLDIDGRHVFPGPTDPDGYRSFSGNPSVVAADGTAFMLGMMHGGVLPVVKHFPGLGGSSGNTDDGPATTLPWHELQAESLPVFEHAFQRGAPAVMISNAVVPGLTSVPASISEVATTSVLKQQMSFGGLVITDSLSAGALSDIGDSVSTAAVKAIASGADMVLFNGGTTSHQDLAAADGVSRALVAAVDSGKIPRTRVLTAVLAVLSAKHLNLCAG